MNSARVLYLVPDLVGPPGGIARYCRMVCHALADEQYQVTTIALMDSPQYRREARRHFPRMEYSACNKSRARFVQKAFRAARMCPDVILVGHPNLAPLGWLLSKIWRAQLVTFIYGVDVWEPLSSTRQNALRASYSVISISRFTAEQAVKNNHLSLESIKILPNCVDPTLISSPRENTKNIASKPLELLTVSRILSSEMHKGHDQVIRVLPDLLRAFPNLIYNVVGDGEGRQEVEELARELNVADAVNFHGVVSEKELQEFYLDCDIFIMPSRREGFGFVFIEAMAHGMPVIGGNQDATPEVIQDGITGFIIDPTSIPDIVDATARLLGDDSLRQKMGQSGVELVHKKFGFDTFRMTLNSYLTEVLNGRNS